MNLISFITFQVYVRQRKVGLILFLSSSLLLVLIAASSAVQLVVASSHLCSAAALALAADGHSKRDREQTHPQRRTRSPRAAVLSSNLADGQRPGFLSANLA